MFIRPLCDAGTRLLPTRRSATTPRCAEKPPRHSHKGNSTSCEEKKKKRTHRAHDTLAHTHAGLAVGDLERALEQLELRGPLDTDCAAPAVWPGKTSAPRAPGALTWPQTLAPPCRRSRSNRLCRLAGVAGRPRCWAIVFRWLRNARHDSQSVDNART